MRGTVIAAALIGVAALAAAAGTAGGPPPAGQKTGYNLPLGVCDWTIGKTGDPAAFELAARLLPRRRSGQPRPQGRFAGPGGPRPAAGLPRGGRKSAHPHRLLRHRRSQRRPAQERPQGRDVAGKGIEVAAAMEVKVILVPFFGKGELRNDPAGVDAVVAALKRLAPAAEAKGVVLALESYLSAGDNIEDPRAGRIAGRQGLLRRRQLPGRGLSHPRRDPRARRPHRRGPRQGHQGPLRQGLDGFSGRPQGAGGHRLQGLVRPGGHGDAARRRGEHPLRRGLSEDGFRHQVIPAASRAPERTRSKKPVSGRRSSAGATRSPRAARLPTPSDRTTGRCRTCGPRPSAPCPGDRRPGPAGCSRRARREWRAR